MNPHSDDSHNQHQHLRLVLGSILSPKRPYSVSSSSSVSGTASPVHPWSIHHHVKGVHPPDNTPATSVLSTPPRSSASPDSASHTSNSPSPMDHHVMSHTDDDVVHDSSPLHRRPPLAVIGDGEHGADCPGQRTPSRKVIATLQSKSAWDVLIHGSMV